MGIVDRSGQLTKEQAVKRLREAVEQRVREEIDRIVGGMTPEGANRVREQWNKIQRINFESSDVTGLPPEDAKEFLQRLSEFQNVEIDWPNPTGVTGNEFEPIPEEDNGGTHHQFPENAKSFLGVCVSKNQKVVLDPPKGAKFALLMIPQKNREHLIGDLEEEYRTIVLPEYGRFRANIWYWVQTVQAVGFYIWPFVKRVLGMAAIGKVIGR